ncbi:unnamed protein product [Cladocopium goreaui]|uniref:Uncharacterized protein n=1 Tax=Cladocopium goreaui TaxID=2562237 RepID=A0A9P1FVB7_9DINO|nr:unnamed protein product [Cladocopium goreaui]
MVMIRPSQRNVPQCWVVTCKSTSLKACSRPATISWRRSRSLFLFFSSSLLCLGNLGNIW